MESKIRNARKAANLTLKALAERIGVTHQCVSDWERNPEKLTSKTLHKLAEALNVPAQTLI